MLFSSSSPPFVHVLSSSSSLSPSLVPPCFSLIDWSRHFSHSTILGPLDEFDTIFPLWRFYYPSLVLIPWPCRKA